MQFSKAGITLLEHHEGRRHTAYDDLTGKSWVDSQKGAATIGIGHLIKIPSEKWMIEYVMSDQQIDALLKHDISWAVASVNSLVQVYLGQNQFDALVSLVYNIGAGNFMGSTLRGYLNRGEYSEAASEFWKWRRSKGIILRGLVLRRADEEALFRSDIVD